MTMTAVKNKKFPITIVGKKNVRSVNHKAIERLRELAEKAGMVPLPKRRIFIVSDVLKPDELRHAQREVAGICDDRGEKYPKNVFDECLDFAWHDLEKTWAAVKTADEIYASSALMPLVGGSYMGAPVIFNGMCERAIKEGITGKSVFILRRLKDIWWKMIDFKLMKKAFKHNNLFMFGEDYGTLIKVDTSKLKKD